MSAKEPYISTKEPCVSTKELCVSTKEPCVFTKAPFIFAKKPRMSPREPCISKKQHYIPAKEPYPFWRCLLKSQFCVHFLCMSFYISAIPKRALYIFKRAIYIRKSSCPFVRYLHFHRCVPFLCASFCVCLLMRYLHHFHSWVVSWPKLWDNSRDNSVP